MILTIDLGTSTTKVGFWDRERGLLAMGRDRLATGHPRVGWAEQDPTEWWPSVVRAGVAARSGLGRVASTENVRSAGAPETVLPAGAPGPAGSPGVAGAVEAVVFSAARQTFVPVTERGEPIGQALLWSDRRATVEARQVAGSLAAGQPGRPAVGMVLDGASVAAKIRWLEVHEPRRLAASRWLVSPRDLVAWWCTGRWVSDPTMASASGLFDADGVPLDALAGGAVDRLLPVVPSQAVIGQLHPAAAGDLGVPAGVPVVIGAGDRACEVLGVGAAPDRPMVSWGTTANVSVPSNARDWDRSGPPGAPAVQDPVGPSGRPGGPAATYIVTRGARGDWLHESGLSAAGSLFEWLGRITGREVPTLFEAAERSPPGARGVLVAPWLGGARAPWWDDRLQATIFGLSSAHEVGDLARAGFEAVAFEVSRCLEAVGARTPSPEGEKGPMPSDGKLRESGGRDPVPGRDAAGAGTPGSNPGRSSAGMHARTELTDMTEIGLAGAGASLRLWADVLSTTAGRPVVRRRSGEPASAGAALVGFEALGVAADLDLMDPVVERRAPVPTWRDPYRMCRARSDRLLGVLADLARGSAEFSGNGEGST